MLGIQNNSSSKIQKAFLTNFEELHLHIKNQEKHKGYKRLCRDFGINSNKIPFEYPKLTVAEQSGYLFYGEVLLRHRLLKMLFENGGFHKNSGFYSLSTDLVSFYGGKRQLMEFVLHPFWKKTQFISEIKKKHYRRWSYSTLPIKGSITKRIDATFGFYSRMLNAALTAPKVFVREVLEIRAEANGSKFIPKLLPIDCSKKYLGQLAVMLQKYDLEKAKKCFQVGVKKLSEDCLWSKYWDSVNESFLNTRISH